ncbi:MAG: phosphoribosylformylglycinamidine synthase I [Candidatus Omnitrophota bacterium]|jgi:phosphoribosylformylglycinamidine synthase
MKKVKTLILRTAGTNCDMETVHAFREAGSEVDLLHINALMKNKKKLSGYQILAIPGGFTYGDDIASGKILANELKHALKRELSGFVRAGKLVIGICNGFQVLVKMGILPDIKGEKSFKVDSTLSLNDSGKFEDRWVYLKKNAADKCIWTKDLPGIIYLPVAHAEGKFIPKDSSVLKKLKSNGQVVFRYTSEDGGKASYPENPNGSVDAIAGICDPTGRILGLMPHPERHVTYLQHPNWRRFEKKDKSLGIGLQIFKNGVNFARNYL